MVFPHVAHIQAGLLPEHQTLTLLTLIFDFVLEVRADFDLIATAVQWHLVYSAIILMAPYSIETSSPSIILLPCLLLQVLNEAFVSGGASNAISW